MTAIEKVNKVLVQDNSVESLISQAIAGNVPVETLERLFGLREKVKAEKAREAFVDAMAVFQSNCPVIKKTKKVMNKDGRTIRYTFAPIDSIVEQIKSPLASARLSYTWDVKEETGKITAICTITHALGHSSTSSFSVPIDQEGYMTAPQKVASALTFAKRYTLCNALGISTGEEDTDATDVGKEPGAKSAKSRIIFSLKALGKKTATKEDCAAAVKQLTKIDLETGDMDEIANRLDILVSEHNENAQIH